MIDQTRFPGYVRALFTMPFIYLSCHIAFLDSVESDIDDSDIIFNTLIHFSFSIYKNIFYKSIEA